MKDESNAHPNFVGDRLCMLVGHFSLGIFPGLTALRARLSPKLPMLTICPLGREDNPAALLVGQFWKVLPTLHLSLICLNTTLSTTLNTTSNSHGNRQHSVGNDSHDHEHCVDAPPTFAPPTF